MNNDPSNPTSRALPDAVPVSEWLKSPELESRNSRHQARLPKLCGADIELGNFIAGVDKTGGTGPLASRLLLAQISGFPTAQGYGQKVVYQEQDWGRKFLKENGGCIYIDLAHLELALPEVLSARDHVAAWHAMLRLARYAQESVNADLPSRRTIEVLVNNSDGLGNSYGSHLDFLITRHAWDELFQNRLHTLLFLVGFQVSSIVMTGQGKVGSENGRPPVPFQISQRADFFEVLMSEETTRRRPLANTRNEPLCGGFREVCNGAIPALEMARLHVIFYDNTLCPVACLLKVGVMQIVLAMIEAGRVNPNLILDNPLDAIWRWSHDPSLKARAGLIGGRELTAVELQLCFFEEAKSFVEAGGCDGYVPHAQQILALWGDTLQKLSTGNLDALTSRIDWILKASLLNRARAQHPDWTWDSPELKTLDLMYGSPRNGLYWACERAGMIEPVVSEAEIEHFTHEPPEDTRAWTRAMLLRHATPEDIVHVDWDEMEFRLSEPETVENRLKVVLSNPLRFTKADTESRFKCAETFAELLKVLGAKPPWAKSWSDGGATSHWSSSHLTTENQTAPPESPAYSPDSNAEEKTT